MDNHNIKNDEKIAEENAIDDWLPITDARSATWYHSAFHNVTAMVGAAFLRLPYALSELGCYSTIAWTASLKKGIYQENVDYSYRDKTTSGSVLNFFSAMGDAVFAFAGHNVVLKSKPQFL